METYVVYPLLILAALMLSLALRLIVRDTACRDLVKTRVVYAGAYETGLDQTKSDLLAMTSHELRTPLHSIQGFVKLMLEERVPDPQTEKELLTIIDGQCERLRNLVNDLVDASAAESGKMRLKKEHLSVNEVIDRVVLKLGNLAKEKGITLERQLPATLPITDGDSGRIEQVVTNLVSNAIKFSAEKGTVILRAGLRDAGLLVQVIDQGIGIPAEAVPHLFQKFSQVDNPVTHGSGGSGLGLYIAKQIIAAHGGQIWVESKPGEGSTFSFTLPLSGIGASHDGAWR